MRDLIRMAGYAYHYLAVFDEHQSRPLYLGRSRRIASADQRAVLYAKDRGCSHPGCDVSGYYSEVHHCTPYAKTRTTDVNDPTFGCGGHHPLGEQGWTTRKNQRGDTEQQVAIRETVPQWRAARGKLMNHTIQTLTALKAGNANARRSHSIS